MKRARLLVAVLSLCAVAVSAAGPGLERVKQTGLNGGLLYLPRASDPEAVVALARETPFVVVARCADDARAAAVRDRAAAESLLARKLYADTGPADAVPLAPHSATIVLADDLAAADLTHANLAAWRRALSPLRGLAILGNRDAYKLDAARLRAWIGNESGATVETVAGGVFAVVRAPALAGSDAWTQKFHDASNRRLSNYTALKPPFRPAWYALPTNLGFWGDTMVSAGGRAYYIWANRAAGASVSLICFDIRNGARLWEQPFKWAAPRDKNEGGYYPGRPCMVALSDGLLLIDEDRVRRLDGETGRELASIPGPKPGGQIKWVGAEDGLLAALAGEADRFDTSSLQQHSTNPFGAELAVYRLGSSGTLWNATEEGPIDEREIAILDGRLFYHAAGRKVACRELKTGRVVWENRDPKVLATLGERVDTDVHALLISCRILAATPKALYFSASLLKNRVALDPATGALLWSEPVGNSRGRSLPDVVAGDSVFRDGEYDLATNKKLSDRRVVRSGCGPSLATTTLFIGAFGNIESRDGALLRESDLKPACDLGVVIADGVAFSPPGICHCGLEIHGYRAFTSAVEPVGGTPPTRWQPGPAQGKPLGAAVAATDWPAWRHDNRRSGSTPVRAPAAAPAPRWTWRPVQTNDAPLLATGYGAKYLDEPEHLPTQAVCAGDLVVFADAQGVLRAVSLKDGAERWRYAIGARLLAPPAVARGRVVAGAADGGVYVVDAATGQLAWRYRVPPGERRIMWFGHLVDTWPLCGGALVEGDAVFAVAGFQSGYGVHAAALDLATGRPRWTQHLAADADPGRGVGAMGALAVARGKLFFHSGGIVPASFALADGAPTIVPDVSFAGDKRFGKDLAALDDDWLVYGGRRVYGNFNRWARSERAVGFNLCRTDLDLTGKPPLTCIGADFVGESIFLPVFDDELVVACFEYPGRGQVPALQAWKRADLVARAAAENAPRGGQRNLLRKQSPYCFGTLLEEKAALPSGGLWTDCKVPVFTAALCPNALLAVHPKGGNKDDLVNWQLSALDRGTGAAVWTVDLPGRPAWDGLSVAPDGTILLAMWDGSVIGYGSR